MSGLPLGLVIEAIVAVLLATTIGYCVVLNAKLKGLQTDRAALQQMIGDLVNATNMANGAIKGLKHTAVECDEMLSQRLAEADRFTIEMANHVSAGHTVIDRIAKITSAASAGRTVPPQPDPHKARSALDALQIHQQRRRENAA